MALYDSKVLFLEKPKIKTKHLSVFVDINYGGTSFFIFSNYASYHHFFF